MLNTGRTWDRALASIARNILLEAVRLHICISVIHVVGKNNAVTDLLSRRQNSTKDWQTLHNNIHSPIWIKTDINITSFCLTGLSTPLKHLANRAFHRAKSAFKLYTNKSYAKKFRLFIAFCIFHKLLSISSAVLLAFLDFLISQKFTYSAILNHLSAVKTPLPLQSISNQPCADPKSKFITEII